MKRLFLAFRCDVLSLPLGWLRLPAPGVMIVPPDLLDSPEVIQTETDVFPIALLKIGFIKGCGVWYPTPEF